MKAFHTFIANLSIVFCCYCVSTWNLMMMKNGVIYRKTAAKAAHTIALCCLFSVLLLTIQSDSFT